MRLVAGLLGQAGLQRRCSVYYDRRWLWQLWTIDGQCVYGDAQKIQLTDLWYGEGWKSNVKGCGGYSQCMMVVLLLSDIVRFDSFLLLQGQFIIRVLPGIMWVQRLVGFKL